jgi:pyruvate/2-oxoglutarate dehydrogenase complex dihydrolipoamide dehydrogenase (E3) component
MPGKNVVILGSGDVGLIMARRLKFEGANVLGVVEILPHASGLPRNVVQCLDDYDIPLFLNHTITYIKGRNRLESVRIAQVNDKGDIIKSSEKEMKCDTLLLSLGLIPENELANDLGIKIDGLTGGPCVNQNLETSYEGVFSCGNCLQVYDTVDVLSIDAKKAGKNAALFAQAKIKRSKDKISVKAGKNIRYVVPQIIDMPGKIHFTLRVEKPCNMPYLEIKSREKLIFKKKLPWANPANMVEFDFEITEDLLKERKDLEVILDG